ncbi:cytochrome bc1 complex Rieske iron-sulfur protein [Candidatus Halobonum tyrrellensis]|uniref:Cytochrome bc1 complex Rieske iron-sulfur protein n=1 Tax=Candidatus Halobonum tyrrellensis G22 TaxID=1324957 RepID=V4HDL5_9EURY|nr:cytochrome bc1 complex Rieske iron-sulfur protein [Candidatus Halobonum tyrrellensis]ESP88168.1 cytochrome bc1 complex Rieske iron-sulfur protein [Candidatus Halobonum tyrrellensis G22]
MSANDDKYPGESGRRRFVKGVVGGAALAGVGAGGAAAVNSVTTSPGTGGGSTRAMAIENTDGPAPRGMPQIPLEVTSDGYVEGVWPEVKTVTENNTQITVAEMDLGGKTYSSEWFQYCGIQTYTNVAPDYDGDNFFRSGQSPAYDWQSEAMSGGERFTVDLFDNYESWGNGIGVPGLGKPATGTWRSQESEDTLPIQLLRSPLIEQLAETGRATGADGETYEVDAATQEWLQASTAEGFIAWLNKCTHFCCIPGYKQTESSAKFAAANEVYCPCHQSVYEPFSIVETVFTSLPRPDE